MNHDRDGLAVLRKRGAIPVVRTERQWVGTAIGVSTLNGGYWGPVRDTCRLTTRAHGPTFRFYQVGFRCCSDAIDGIATPPVVMHSD